MTVDPHTADGEKATASGPLALQLERMDTPQHVPANNKALLVRRSPDHVSRPHAAPCTNGQTRLKLRW